MKEKYKIDIPAIIVYILFISLMIFVLSVLNDYLVSYAKNEIINTNSPVIKSLKEVN